MQKILYFIAGISPTVDEQAEIDAIVPATSPQFELAIRSNTAGANYGEDRPEPCDFVAGTLPASGLYDEVDTFDPNNMPESGVEANQYVLTDGDQLSDDTGVLATGTVTFGGQPLTTETVAIGGKTYRFIAALAQANDVLIGATAADTRNNLVAAINAAAGIGVTYGTGTTVNANVTAAPSGGNIALTAKPIGTAGNAVVLTESATNVTVSGSGTLSGGVDAATIDVAIVDGIPTFTINA